MDVGVVGCGAVSYTRTVDANSPQRVEQRFRLDEVPRAEALGEPGVERGQELARFGGAAPIAEQPREARRGAELEGSGLLLARDVQRVAEERLDVRRSSGLGVQQQRA